MVQTLTKNTFYAETFNLVPVFQGILKTKDNSLRLNIEDDSFMSKASSAFDTSNLMSFSPLPNRLNNTSIVNTSNLTLLGGHNESGDMTADMSFNKTAKLHAFDMTFTNVSGADQSGLVRLKEAFQLFLRKDEVC